jgi:hypothetical protein
MFIRIGQFVVSELRGSDIKAEWKAIARRFGKEALQLIAKRDGGGGCRGEAPPQSRLIGLAVLVGSDSHPKVVATR